MSQFSDAVEETILANAGPFTAINEAGRTGLAAFLAVPVEIDGVTLSRAAHCAANDRLMIDFHKRLGFVGRFAAEAGLDRIRHAAARREPACLELVHDDLQEGEAITSTASATGLCDPP